MTAIVIYYLIFNTNVEGLDNLCFQELKVCLKDRVENAGFGDAGRLNLVWDRQTDTANLQAVIGL